MPKVSTPSRSIAGSSRRSTAKPTRIVASASENHAPRENV
jgi:hypothetical protein